MCDWRRRRESEGIVREGTRGEYENAKKASTLPSIARPVSTAQQVDTNISMHSIGPNFPTVPHD